MEYTLKKSLGQHFLHEQAVCHAIVDALPNLQLPVLEIGPGAGAITRLLLQQGYPDFRCVELDDEKVAYLSKTFPALKDKIIHGDCLHIPKPFDTEFLLIGNFPYNISSQIVFRLIEWQSSIPLMVGMFQKEVALRVVSPSGKKDYGILSVLTQCYYETEYLFDVSPTCFTPPPKVMSGVIRLTRREQPLFQGDEKKFKTFVKQAFSQKRKTLRNCLKGFVPGELIQDERFNRRAEQVPVAEFVSLYQELVLR
ncbi:MAG: ribosomal RNA small subunit methyltransferase A [Chitinophagaceae bacterium]|nr:ribosomal RNA small subunit methyltransferase A [Chitinophagaceae bacterium]